MGSCFPTSFAEALPKVNRGVAELYIGECHLHKRGCCATDWICREALIKRAKGLGYTNGLDR